MIIFAPVGRANPQQIVSGQPMYGNPLPWKKTELTPNLGGTDETDDMRPGLGWSGLENLQNFVRLGGLLITANDTSNFAVGFGFTPGVTITPAQRVRVPGTVVRSKAVDAASPILYGYRDNLAVFCSSGPIFGVTNFVGGRGGRRGARGVSRKVRRRPGVRGRDAAAQDLRSKCLQRRVSSWRGIPAGELAPRHFDERRLLRSAAGQRVGAAWGEAAAGRA